MNIDHGCNTQESLAAQGRDATPKCTVLRNEKKVKCEVDDYRCKIQPGERYDLSRGGHDGAIDLGETVAEQGRQTPLKNFPAVWIFAVIKYLLQPGCQHDGKCGGSNGKHQLHMPCLKDNVFQRFLLCPK